VYLAGALADHAGVEALRGYGALSDHFELFGYVIVTLFVTSWSAAVLLWRLRYGHREVSS
jgi:high-affinity nickel-transport protein